MSLALDTNVLVRFLVRDDEEQHRQARELIRGVIAAASGRFCQYFFGISARIACTLSRAGLKMCA